MTFTKTLLVSVSLASMSNAATYYVAPSGNNSGPGTIAQPFATIQGAHERVSAGDTVYLRGGTYPVTRPQANDAGILLWKSGASDTRRIYYWAYPGERPIFDFSRLEISTSSYTHGMVVTGSWLHLKGLEICCVPMNTNSNVGLYVRESGDNIFELIKTYRNNGSGVFVNDSKGRGGHLFLNCDSHDNYDPTGRQGDGQNGDGFGVHYQTTGKVTAFRGCRAWWNSDDGWDLISQEVPVVIENSWAMGNGWANFGTRRPADGNGNGFKAGSSKTGIRHTIQQCVAWKNRASGFYANHSSGGNNWYNNTSYRNGTQYNLWASTWDAAGNRTDGVVLTGSKAHVMRNNIGFPHKNSYMEGVDSRSNTWDLNITPRESDFLSIDDPSMHITGQDLSTMAGAFGPRQPNGDLPDIPFLKLSAQSQMMDRGVDVGLPAINTPDLGAYEFGAVVQTFSIGATATPGGIVQQNPPGIALARGNSVEFLAVPLDGWEFVGWGGGHSGSNPNYRIAALESDLSLVAEFRFVARDSSLYEGENTKLYNSIVESVHPGFSGSGYANFNNELGSSIEFSVVVSESGEKGLWVTYANGATTDRSISISVNGQLVRAVLNFDTTGSWETWNSVSIPVYLRNGVNTIQFTSITEFGGPNIDKIELRKEVPVSAQYNPANHGVTTNLAGNEIRIQLFTLQGAVIFSDHWRAGFSANQFHLPMDQLPRGVYVLKLSSPGLAAGATITVPNY